MPASSPARAAPRAVIAWGAMRTGFRWPTWSPRSTAQIGVTQCSIHAPSCERTSFCPTRPHWQRVNEIVGTALAAVSLAEMLPPARTFMTDGPEPGLSNSDRLSP